MVAKYAGKMPLRVVDVEFDPSKLLRVESDRESSRLTPCLTLPWVAVITRLSDRSMSLKAMMLLFYDLGAFPGRCTF